MKTGIKEDVIPNEKTVPSGVFGRLGSGGEVAWVCIISKGRKGYSELHYLALVEATNALPDLRHYLTNFL
jgi:hypothetical protein